MIEHGLGQTHSGGHARAAVPNGAMIEAATPAGAGALYERASALAGIGAWECDIRTSALTWTGGVFDIFGLPRDCRIDRRDIVDMYCEASREAMERLRADAIAHHRGFSLDARIIRADGTPRWMRLTAGTVLANGRSTHLYGVKQDITAERARWEAMRLMAEQDALTGLASRSIFQTRFLDSPRSMPMLSPLGALMLFDVDGFKGINDQWGHAAGDACLQAVAARLTASFPDALMVARIGGDEFAVLAPAGRTLAAYEHATRRLLTAIARPIAWQGKLLQVSASAGLAGADDPAGYDAEELFATADAALYRAKRAGRGTLWPAAPLDPPRRAALG